MKIEDYYDIEMISNDDPTNLTNKADVRISFKDFCKSIAKSKSFRKILVKYLVEDGLIPAEGD